MRPNASAPGARVLCGSQVDLFKTQMQVQLTRDGGRFRSVFHCAGHIARHHGVAGCFQGLCANSLRFVPGRAVYFASFEVADRNLSPPAGRGRGGGDARRSAVSGKGWGEESTLSRINVPATFAAGAFAGVCAWTSTYPFDVIRNKIMAGDPDRTKRLYRGVWDCARTTARMSALQLPPCVSDQSVAAPFLRHHSLLFDAREQDDLGSGAGV